MFRARTSPIILVVDDEGVTQIFARMLQRGGYEVRNGWEAQNSAEGGLVVGRR